jgi:Domain of unknown function (DUF4129)
MSPVDGIYPIAIGLAEGGWVAVVYVLVDAVARVHPSLGAFVFAIAAGACCLAAPWIDRHTPTRLVIVFGLLLGGALVGLLLAASAGLVIAARTPLGALKDDPGAVLVGLAALRGFIRAGALQDVGQAARPFFVGLVGLAGAWAFGGALIEPWRSAFREASVIPTLAFVAGSLAATGLARAAYAASDAELDPRTNRPWLVALLGVALAVGLAALPIGQGAERVLAALIGWQLTLPILILSAIVARILVPSRRRALRRAGAFTIAPLVALAVLAVIAAVLPHDTAGPTPQTGGPVGFGQFEPTSPAFGIALTLSAIALIAGVVVFLARSWRRNADVDRIGSSPDSRTYALGRDASDDGGPGLGGRLRRLVRRGRPRDAVEAYLALLRALEPDAELRRDAAETPAAHARRLRELGLGTLELDLLAADFELARWGARRLSSAEDRRAVGRSNRLRAVFAGRSARGSPEPTRDPRRGRPGRTDADR